MPRTSTKPATKKRRAAKKETRSSTPSMITADRFLDIAIFRGKVKEVQRAELKAWFKDHKLNKATEQDFQNSLDTY